MAAICWLLPLVALVLPTGNVAAPAGPVTIFSTGFEVAEGYDPASNLAGQQGWVQEGDGGNGLLTDFIPGGGQQAYIGFSSPTNSDVFINVWRPVNYAPVPAGVTVVRFSVVMRLVPSKNGQADDFRWSVYNRQGARLFTLDFAMSTREVSYVLDDNAGFIPTTFLFEEDGVYDLELLLNLKRNLWTAILNDVVILSGKPLTTRNATLDLGDIDAVWAIRKPGQAGDNFMVFDDYKVMATTFESIPSKLEAISLPPDGQFLFRFFGEPGRTYAVEVSDDLRSWFRLGTYLMPFEGSFDFEDTSAPGHSRGFYRSVLELERQP